MSKSGVRSSAIGSYNRGLVLESIRLHRGSSRVEVAGRTGLTPAAVSNIVRGLMQDGVVLEIGRGSSTGGKPRTSLRVASGARYSLGVHIDPRAVFAVLLDLDGAVTAQRTFRLNSPRPKLDNVLDKVAAMAQSLLTGIDTSRLAGIGLACPGPIDSARGTLVRTPNLPGWDGAPIQHLLQRRLAWPIVLENDANAAAIGEKWVGAAHDVGNFLYVYVGAGVGGAIFVDHRIYRGGTTNAGAIGHMTIRENGRPCGCGNRGCLEAYCSQRAIVEAGRRHSALTDLDLSFQPESVARDHRIIARAAASGHPGAADIIAAAAGHLATGVSSLVNVLDVEAIYLGGHVVAANPDQYVRPVVAAVADRPVARALQRVRVVPSSHGSQAGAIGAASVVLQQEYGPSIAA